MKVMDHNLFTGNPKLDFVGLAIAWLFVWMTPAQVPIILSSIASLLVIVNQIIVYKTRKKKN
jgi:hypothetical protein